MIPCILVSAQRCALLLCIAVGAIVCYTHKDMSVKDLDEMQLFQNQNIRVRLANELLENMLLVAENLYRSMGANEMELTELKRKRSAITACYFQAVSCY